MSDWDDDGDLVIPVGGLTLSHTRMSSDQSHSRDQPHNRQGGAHSGSIIINDQVGLDWGDGDEDEFGVAPSDTLAEERQHSIPDLGTEDGARTLNARTIKATTRGVLPSFEDLSLLPGKVSHLNPVGTGLDESEDWGDDMDFDIPGNLTVKARSSLAANTPAAQQPDIQQARFRPTVRQTRPLDDDFDESDFDLPAHLSHIAMSPLLAPTSTCILHSSSFPTRPVTRLVRQPSATKHAPSSASSVNSHPDDDADFFDDLELPSYFVGGPGAMTPPSEGESRSRLGKVNLQHVLQAKVAARSKVDETESILLDEVSLYHYQDKTEDEAEEQGLEIDEGIQLGLERMIARPTPLLKGRSRSQTTPTQPRRAAVALSRIPTAPSLLPSRIPQQAPSTATRYTPGSTIPVSPSSLAFKERARTRTLTRQPSITRFSTSSTPVQSNRLVPRLETTMATPPLAPPSPALSPPSTNNTLRKRPSSGPLLQTPGLYKRAPIPTSPALVVDPSLAARTFPSSTLTPSLIGASPRRSASRSTESASALFSYRTPIFPVPPSQTTSPTRASTSRLTLPTLASQARARVKPLAGLRTFSYDAAIALKRPKRARVYGDGTELEGFDDLPTSHEREQTRQPHSRVATSLHRKASDNSSAIGKVGMDPNLTLKAVTGQRIQGATIKASSTRTLQQQTSEPRTTGGAAKRKRREPHLIRNLGAVNVAKVQDGMVWNPIDQRWEGNEKSLKAFDNPTLTRSSARPTLFTPLQIQPGPTSRLSLSSTSSSRSNKVVGSMVFDPVRMGWFSLEPEGEDELDLSMSEADLADDQEDGWGRGERARMVKKRESLLVQDGDLGDLWAQSVEAQTRHELEMQPWQQAHSDPVEKRDWLWDIRKLVLDSQSP